MTELIPEQAKRPVAPDPAHPAAPGARNAKAFGDERAADAYEIVGTIGRGGMGDVLLAVDRRLGRRVAIKRLRPERRADPAVRGRFLREARAAAALSSAHIVHIYAIGEDEEGPYIAMEYVESALPPPSPGAPRPPQTLEQRVQASGVYRPREALALLLKVGRAMETAHAAGVVHRDLKPSNILLDADGEPKVADFGLAHLSGDGASGTSGGATLTVPGEKLLTLGYGAPEQEVDASRCDARTDVYGLGALLFFALTGKNPRFFREDELPVSLRPLLSKALATDPARRHPTAAAFDADIAARLADARPAIPTVRTTWRCKWCGTVNPIEKRFCDGCGWNGQVHCLECDAEMRFGIQFCGACGANQAAYESAQDLLRRIDRAVAARDFAHAAALAESPLSLEPAGPAGRRLLETVRDRREEARAALDRAARLREAIPVEMRAGNYERAAAAIDELRTLSAAPEDQHAGEREGLPALVESRDLDRIERALAERDWTVAGRLLLRFRGETKDGELRAARYARLLGRHRRLRKALAWTGCAAAAVALYFALAPLAAGSSSKTLRALAGPYLALRAKSAPAR